MENYKMFKNCTLKIVKNKIIRGNLALIAGILLLSSCSSLQLPTVEESQKKIDEIQPLLKITDDFINSNTSSLPKGTNIDLGVKQATMNRLLTAMANDKDKDLTIKFLPTKNLIDESKKVLGIEYRNYINVDKGFVDMDLKALKFNTIDGSKIEAMIEIEGEGNISLSGKHTGIAASVTSEIYLYLKENVEFKIHYSDSGYVILKPQPKKLKLKTKFAIAILKWNIPWREEIELEFTDLLPPIAVPFALATDLNLPIPSKKDKGGFVSVPYEVKFSKVSLKADYQVMHWRSDIDFKRK
jgi:hypothetical protein